MPNQCSYLFDELRLLGFFPFTRIPGRHEKVIERYIQTLENKRAAVLGGIPKVLPSFMDLSLWRSVVTSSRMLPCTVTGPNILPVELVEQLKPDLSRFLPIFSVHLFKEADGTSSQYIIVGNRYNGVHGYDVWRPGCKQFLLRTTPITDQLLAIPSDWNWTDRILPHPLLQTPTFIDSNSLEDSSDAQVAPIVPSDIVSTDDTSSSSSSSTPIAAVHDDNSSTSQDDSLPTTLGSSWEGGVRSSLRNKSLATTMIVTAVNVITLISIALTRKQVQDSIKSNDQHILKAIDKEISVIIDNDSLDFMVFDELDPAAIQTLMSLLLIVVKKLTATGDFDKFKARICVNGKWQHISTFDQTPSTTAQPAAVMTQIQIGINEDAEMYTFDVPSAFLHSVVRGQDHLRPMYVVIEPFFAQRFIAKYPHLSSKLSKNGCLYARLKKDIYGTHDASGNFQLTFAEVMDDLKYTRLTSDNCLYQKYSDKGCIRVSTHVDDGFVTSTDPSLSDELNTHLKSKFKGLNVQKGDTLSFLGLNIVFKPDGVFINQIGFLTETLNKFGFAHCKAKVMPYGIDLLVDTTTQDPLSTIDSKLFLSMVMSLMYAARFTRADILFVVTYLASKAQSPTATDLAHLKAVFHYLQGTLNRGIFIRKGKLILYVWADASYGIHFDCKGHTGLIFMLGESPILCVSTKQILQALSSTEAEIIGVAEAVKYIQWFKSLLAEMNVELHQTILYQDNQSVIKILKNGGTFKGTKHYRIRIAYCQETIKLCEIDTLYAPTETMRSDFLTKPVPSKIFNALTRDVIVDEA